MTFADQGGIRMTNFVLLYTGGGMPETEEEMAAVTKAWGDWYARLGQAIVDGGAPFSPMSKNIASDGTVTDGPVGTPATGYTVVKAGSLDQALEMAKGCPQLQAGGEVTVYETFQVGEM
jgi:hypothetical protein